MQKIGGARVKVNPNSSLLNYLFLYNFIFVHNSVHGRLPRWFGKISNVKVQFSFELCHVVVNVSF